MLIRAKYYITNDLMLGYSLQRTEEVLKSFSPSYSYRDINDILEFYNIIQIFVNKIYLKTWDSSIIKKYTEIVKQLHASLGKFLNSIDGNDLCQLFQQTDNRFKNDFFTVLTEYKVIERITKDQFYNFIMEQPKVMKYILCNKRLVNKYGQVIADYLSNRIEYAELVIKHYFIKHEYNNDETFIPNELSLKQKEKIIQDYVNWDNANNKYLDLISRLKKPGDYPISDEIRFQAYKRVRSSWNDYFKKENTAMRIGVEIRFINQEEPVLEKYIENENENTECISYNRQWFSKNLDFPTLLNNFIYLFDYVDIHYRCQFISNPNFIGFIERMIELHADNEYTTGIGFKCVQNLSNIQMVSYRALLQEHNIEIEKIFKWFFEEYLKKEFGVENYLYFAPSPQSITLEKILLIASQLDAVLKQFRVFLNNETIDRELFEFSSGVYKIVDTPSMINNKYLYPNGSEINIILYYLFSNQSMLSYTERTGDKYNTFVQLLKSEDIKIIDYPDDDHAHIKWLIEKGVIFEDEKKFLRMEYPLFHLLDDLQQNGCIAFSYCSKREQELVEKMIKEKYLLTESKLFTKQEQNYLDYMLNVQKFFNGPELRNKYVHGNFSQDTQIHEKDYIELLKIMTLIVLKINEEFCLKYPSNEHTIVVVP